MLKVRSSTLGLQRYQRPCGPSVLGLGRSLAVTVGHKYEKAFFLNKRSIFLEEWATGRPQQKSGVKICDFFKSGGNCATFK